MARIKIEAKPTTKLKPAKTVTRRSFKKLARQYVPRIITGELTTDQVAELAEVPEYQVKRWVDALGPKIQMTKPKDSFTIPLKPLSTPKEPKTKSTYTEGFFDNSSDVDPRTKEIQRLRWVLSDITMENHELKAKLYGYRRQSDKDLWKDTVSPPIESK